MQNENASGAIWPGAFFIGDVMGNSSRAASK
jgi:hypothetical protein